MSEELQGLLEKIQSDGIKKAESEKEAIITAAKAEAAKIVSQAKAEAESFAAKAKAEAEADCERANAAIKQAARDVVIALRSELLAKLNAVARDCAGTAMNPELMGSMILEMTKAYAMNPNADAGLEILVNKKDASALEDILKGRLLAALKSNPVINLTNDFAAGLQLSFKGDDVYFDFSDEAVADILCAYAGPKLAAVIKG